ncbi:MAG TPA: acetate--CoA ligase family protein [Steroidobacteraceae bacterium]|nr:acetate--CoA ligase family protein [Steroidobacteraceae bacterium]
MKDLLNPRSVAVIGATERPHSVGAAVMQNLLTGGFEGPIWPVSLHRPTVAGRKAYASVSQLPQCPDLAVLCTPAPTIPDLIAQLGAIGTPMAVVISATTQQPCPGGATLKETMLQAAQQHGVRILGPNSVGALVPSIGLNASFAHTTPAAGNIAVIAQSGALTTALLDWARSAGIGLSCLISLGDCVDLDFSDLLDALSEDPKTHAILLYIESVRDGDAFMAAARRVATRKPVIALKAGRNALSAQAVISHTGALAGADEVYEAALRKAGILRVNTTRELYAAAELFAHTAQICGPRLAILSNGGGPGVMAADALISAGGMLATLSPQTRAGLDSVLPPNWSHGNPVDIVGDAPIERYQSALKTLLADDSADAVLLIHAPTAIAPACQIARACLPLLSGATRPVITCWMGGFGVEEARTRCRDAGIAAFETPEEGVTAFMLSVSWNRTRDQLITRPPVRSPNAALAQVRSLIETAQVQGQTVLNEHQAKQVLAAYRIPVVETRIASDEQEAVRIATEMGFPVVMKILSPDITHKSDVGGVALDIETAAALRASAQAMLRRCQEQRPTARLRGFTIQRMVRRPDALELIAGITTDPTFGPVLLFGAGGVDVEVLNDKALAIAPLDLAEATDLIGQTRVSARLAAHRNRAGADVSALSRVLVQLAQLAVDVPEIAELDINPLLADSEGVIALDARIRLRATPPS